MDCSGSAAGYHTATLRPSSSESIRYPADCNASQWNTKLGVDPPTCNATKAVSANVNQRTLREASNDGIPLAPPRQDRNLATEDDTHVTTKGTTSVATWV